MQRTRPRTLALVVVAVTAVGWALFRGLASRGISPPQVPWLVAVVEVVIAGVVLVMGWAVRQYLRGNRPLLDPIRAARTAVLAKASCYTGAILAGWYASQALAVLGDLEFAAQRQRAIVAGVAAVGAVVMVVVGLVVEWWCQVPPPETRLPEDGARPRDPSPDPAST